MLRLTPDFETLHLAGVWRASDAMFSKSCVWWASGLRQTQCLRNHTSGAIFQNEASDAIFENLLPDAIFCDHVSDVYHEWYSVGRTYNNIRLFQIKCQMAKQSQKLKKESCSPLLWKYDSCMTVTGTWYTLYSKCQGNRVVVGLNLRPPTYIPIVFFMEMLHPGGIFGTPMGLDPDFRSQKTRTLGLTRDPPESQFQLRENWDPRVSNELGSSWVKVRTMPSGQWHKIYKVGKGELHRTPWWRFKWLRLKCITSVPSRKSHIQYKDTNYHCDILI